MSQSIDAVLNQRSCMMAVLRIIEENIPEVRAWGGGAPLHPPPHHPGGPADPPQPPPIFSAAVPQPEQQQTLPPGRPFGAGAESGRPEDPRPVAQRGERQQVTKSDPFWL